MALAKTLFAVYLLSTILAKYDCAKINTPRVLLPWMEDLYVTFTFEIIEGGCYTWSLSRDDIIDLEPIYEESWGHCSRAARVSVSKSCVPPGSVIILAEEVNTGEILRGDVDIDKIKALEVVSTTWKLFLEEAPEAFEVVAYDEQENKFTTLEGIQFTWSIRNLGSTEGDELIVNLVRWSDTDYEAPKGIAELETLGFRSYSTLLYGQAIGESQVTVCLADICTKFNLQVVASVVLMPAIAYIAPGDTLKYRVVRARAGRLTIQDISETLYQLRVTENNLVKLEDSISTVRGLDTGSAIIQLMSGSTEISTANLHITPIHSIKVSLRPQNLLIKGDVFLIHCTVLDKEGHALTAGSELLIRLSVEGDANVDLIKSTENGTLTDAIAANSGRFTVTAKLHSIAGKLMSYTVEGQASANVVDPLEIVPPELFVAWTENTLEVPLVHIGGGDEEVVWSERDTAVGALSLAPTGVVRIEGDGYLDVKVHLKKYPHVKAVGRVWSAPHEMIHVSTSGVARVGRPHHLHVVLTATHPTTGDLYNFHRCDCGSFALTLLEGPEPMNTTAATWIEPADGACCVLEVVYISRGVSTVRVSRGRAGDTARIAVRAAPSLLWPRYAAALVGAHLPVIAEGEALTTHSSDARVSELTARDGSAPYRHPDAQLSTLKCNRKGDAHLHLTSHSEEEPESVVLEAACAHRVARLRLDPPDAPHCAHGTKIWLRPGQEISIKTTLFDAIGRELLDERGPKVAWDIEPYHPGITYKALDRLFVENDPEYAPVPVPLKFYQLVATDETAIGWSGVLKAHIPDATATIQAKVVAPLKCDPLQVNLAWEGETLNRIVTVTGGSGRYSVDSPKGTSATVDEALSLTVPGPGSYDLEVTDLCVPGEIQHVEVYIEEVLNVEVQTSRAVGVRACVPISALVRGVSHRYLSTSNEPEYRTSGDVTVSGGRLCGVREGSGRVRASLAGVWSPEIEVLVFPPLQIIPSVARLPPGSRLQLRHVGGPPSHLATLQYSTATPMHHVEVSASGSVHGVSIGQARVKLVAIDIENIEMASAESEVEVIPISNLRVRSATQTLLVGSPSPVWIEAGGLSPTSLAALQPPPRVTFTLRDPSMARLYTSHNDDQLERSIAEGLSVRVVPLKPGVITIDVRVRNMGQVAETRSWDSTIEILGISDIKTAIEGQSKPLQSGDRIALVVGSSIRLKSLPRGQWKAYEDGAFEVSANGELKAKRTGHGVIVAHHTDERNNIYRETAIHVEVDIPHYCTAEPAADGDTSALHVVMRNSVGRRLLAPHGNVTVSPVPADSIQGMDLVITGLDATGAFVTFHASASGVTVKDEVWVTGTDSKSDRVVATGGWGVCLDGVGWRAPSDVATFAGSGVSLALLRRDVSARHTLRHDRAHNTRTLVQLTLDKLEFQKGDWPSSLVPLLITAAGLSGGPLLCTDEQRYAMEGVEINLPFVCRTKAPHTAEPVLDIINNQIGCKIVPATQITDHTELELCAEWGAHRTCSRVSLVPPVHVSVASLSVINQPAVFSIAGHPRALKLVKVTASPGLKVETTVLSDEITCTISNSAPTCGLGWVTVVSPITSQEIRIDVERDCDSACGTLLGALISLIWPYLSTVATMAVSALAYLYVQHRYNRRTQIRLPTEPVLTNTSHVSQDSPTLNRTRTWSRSPYASRGPAVPVYGDASVLPDNSFSPSSRTHSSFL